MNSRKELQYQFAVLLDCFRLNLKATCTVSVVWRCGETSVEMRNRRELVTGVAKLDEELQLSCGVAYDSASQQFLEAKVRRGLCSRHWRYASTPIEAHDKQVKCILISPRSSTRSRKVRPASKKRRTFVQLVSAEVPRHDGHASFQVAHKKGL